MSELSRFEAELDSDIQGLERRLSQKKQHRGWGEVLSPPPDSLCWSIPPPDTTNLVELPLPYTSNEGCAPVRSLCFLIWHVFLCDLDDIVCLSAFAFGSVCFVNRLLASSSTANVDLPAEKELQNQILQYFLIIFFWTLLAVSQPKIVMLFPDSCVIESAS